MSTRAKHVWLIIGFQVGCLAVGFWMQHCVVALSVARAATQQAWSEIKARAGDLFSEFGELALGDHTGFYSLADRSPGPGDVTIVDPGWRVMFSSAVGAQVPTQQESPARRIKWEPYEEGSPDAATWAQGRIALADGDHIAVARARPDGQGYVLFHRPVAEIEANAAALVNSVTAISVMSLVWMCVLLSIAVYIILAHLHDEIDRQRSRSTRDALRQTQHLIRTRDAVIFGLAKLAESRDPETGDHLERISVYSTTLVSAVRRHSKWSDKVTPTFVRLIGISSALHDIGKVGVEDRILLKPGPLTAEERAAMQVHTTIGGECLREVEQRLGSSNFLQMAREIAFSHHENWDGTGYPKGLSGTAIPLSARIVAIADVYDATSCKRVYKDPFPHDECVEIIRRDAGKKFDPELVDVWLKIEPKFRTIAGQFANRAREATPHKAPAIAIADYSDPEIEDLYAVSSSASGGGGHT